MTVDQAKQILRVADNALREIEEGAKLAREALANGAPDTARMMLPTVAETETAIALSVAIAKRWEEIRSCIGLDFTERQDTHAHG